MRTPEGPATQRLEVDGGEVRAQAWGPGADWATERLPRTLGADDDVSTFDPSLHPLVASQWARYGAGMRTPSVGVVLAGGAGWSAPVVAAAGGAAYFVAVADFDADGKLDVVAPALGGATAPVLLRGKGITACDLGLH